MLQLLAEQLKKLAHSGFFATELNLYVEQLLASVTLLQQKVTDAEANLPLITELVDSIWRATQFLTGTTSNRVPYEVTYLLREVLLDWELGDSIVTTSVNQSPDFYCERAGTAPSALIKELNLPDLSVSGNLVQMGVPEIFQHMPLMCSPLYHEVGHYIEEHEGLIAGLFVRQEEKILSCLPDVQAFDKEVGKRVAKYHMTEYFCDLVAATYVGECVSDYIIQWDHDSSIRHTHPIAASRAEVTRDFLEGNSNPVVDLLKEMVSTALNVELTPKFTLPDVKDSFSDVRPIKISSVAELHGLLPAANSFLKNLMAEPSEYANTNIGRVHRSRHAHLVNDLIEKSIRSFMISKAWDESLDKKSNS